MGQRFADDELIKIYQFFIDFFNSLPDQIKIYRDLTVDDPEKYLSYLKKGISYPPYEGAGVYWSWIKTGAYPYSGESFRSWILLEGTINKENVDFEYFIMKNMFLRELKELDPNKEIDFMEMSMKEFISFIEKEEFDQFIEREVPFIPNSDIFIETAQLVKREAGDEEYGIGQPIRIEKILKER